jgi:predicted anti-sigma-YlaC factor YlaD
MLIPVPTSDCLQAREAASARLDGELSELGTARLELHLRDCLECSAYAAEIETIADRLRAAVLERPESRIALPQRRRLPLHAAVAAVAVVAAVAASSIALERGLGTGNKPASATAVTPSALAALRTDILDQHLFAMLRRAEPQGNIQVGRIIFA